MNSFFIEPICNDDVGLEVNNLKNNLTKIYNRAIQTGVYPHDMKLAQVIALYRKGARHDPNNYRPISLLPIFDKILKKSYVKDWFLS